MEKENNLYFTWCSDTTAAGDVNRDKYRRSLKYDPAVNKWYYLGSSTSLDQMKDGKAIEELRENLENNLGIVHQLTDDMWSVNRRVTAEEARSKVLVLLPPKKGRGRR